jgi:uncharacterized iron-regulated membrane protein
MIPMKTFRKILFWSHLVAGLLGGIVILIMCFTGTVLAFEKEIVAWVDRAGSEVAVPAVGTPRLTVEEMVRNVQATQPEGTRVASLIVKADPAAAVTMTAGAATVYVNPYTGQVTPQGAAGTRAFMRTMTTWHRYVGFSAGQRTTGKQIAGAGNVIFFVLAVTGLYIWMPRTWSWRALRPSVWFTAARGKARDWNWHNVIGLWTAPVLIVLTLTALPISYAWASAWINSLNTPAAGTAVTGAPAAAAAAPVAAIMPPEGATRQSFNALLLAAQTEVPDWKQITMRLDGGAVAGRGGGGAPAAGGRGAVGAAGAGRAGGRGEGGRGSGEAGRGGRGARGGEGAPAVPAAATPAAPAAPRGVQPVSFTIREAHSWPRTANTTLMLNPFTAEKVTRTGYAQMATGAQVRAWTRFLHTGEAVGPIGQFVAGFACLGGCFLVYTGFALSWRRFFDKRKTPPAAPAVAKEEEPVLASVSRP